MVRLDSIRKFELDLKYYEMRLKHQWQCYHRILDSLKKEEKSIKLIGKGGE